MILHRQEIRRWSYIVKRQDKEVLVLMSRVCPTSLVAKNCTREEMIIVVTYEMISDLSSSGHISCNGLKVCNKRAKVLTLHSVAIPHRFTVLVTVVIQFKNTNWYCAVETIVLTNGAQFQTCRLCWHMPKKLDKRCFRCLMNKRHPPSYRFPIIHTTAWINIEKANC